MEKTIAAALYVLNKVQGKSLDRHKLFKILYKADQKHLSKYGRTITNDTYIAMDYGPVPSRLYDIIRSDNQYTATTYTDNGSSKIPIEKPLIETDLDRLSKTDIDLLDIAIKENITKSFARLTSETHGYAYEHTALNSPMDIFNIAKEGEAGTEIIEYIQEHLEIDNIVNYA